MDVFLQRGKAMGLTEAQLSDLLSNLSINENKREKKPAYVDPIIENDSLFDNESDIEGEEYPIPLPGEQGLNPLPAENNLVKLPSSFNFDDPFFDETKTLEYKSGLSEYRNGTLPLYVKLMVNQFGNSFMNTNGGHLVFGVRDPKNVKSDTEPKVVKGLPLDQATRDHLRLQVDGIMRKQTPMYRDFDVYFLPVKNVPEQMEAQGERFLMVVTFYKGRKESDPFYRNSRGDSFCRTASSTIPVSEAEVQSVPLSDEEQKEVNKLLRSDIDLVDIKRTNLSTNAKLKLIRQKKAKELQKQAENLPIYAKKQVIIDVIQKGQVTVIHGTTGCGKSTQVPLMLLEANSRSRILVTQPRRVGAIETARRIARQLGVPLGGQVGFKIGGHCSFCPDTQILIVTMGVFREMQLCNSNETYDYILIDEVHERTIDVDIVLTLMKTRYLKTNTKGRLILMSATIDTAVFQNYFHIPNCTPVPCVEIEQAIYPVQELFLDEILAEREYKPNGELTHSMIFNPYNERHPMLGPHRKEYLAQFLRKLGDQLPPEEGILVFLPGMGDIEGVYNYLTVGNKKQKVIMMHSSFSIEEQSGCVEDFIYASDDDDDDNDTGALGSDDDEGHNAIPAPRQRKTRRRLQKVVLATNIAESTITLKGIRHVVDSCLQKLVEWDQESRCPELKDRYACVHQLNQRKGRAGRVGPGKCYRFINRMESHNIPQRITPEICIAPFEEIILRLVDFRVVPQEFLKECPDPPDTGKLYHAIDVLMQMGAIDHAINSSASDRAANPTLYGKEEDLKLTPLGRFLVQVPVSAQMGMFLAYASVFDMLDHAIVIAAIASKSFPIRSVDSQAIRSYRARRKFSCGVNSDLIAGMNAYLEWKKFRNRNPEVSMDDEEAWAEEQWVSIYQLEEIDEMVILLQTRLCGMGLMRQPHFLDKKNSLRRKNARLRKTVPGTKDSGADVDDLEFELMAMEIEENDGSKERALWIPEVVVPIKSVGGDTKAMGEPVSEANTLEDSIFPEKTFLPEESIDDDTLVLLALLAGAFIENFVSVNFPKYDLPRAVPSIDLINVPQWFGEEKMAMWCCVNGLGRPERTELRYRNNQLHLSIEFPPPAPQDSNAVSRANLYVMKFRPRDPKGQSEEEWGFDSLPCRAINLSHSWNPQIRPLFLTTNFARFERVSLCSPVICNITQSRSLGDAVVFGTVVQVSRIIQQRSKQEAKACFIRNVSAMPLIPGLRHALFLFFARKKYTQVRQIDSSLDDEDDESLSVTLTIRARSNRVTTSISLKKGCQKKLEKLRLYVEKAFHHIHLPRHKLYKLKQMGKYDPNESTEIFATKQEARSFLADFLRKNSVRDSDFNSQRAATNEIDQLIGLLTSMPPRDRDNVVPTSAFDSGIFGLK